MVALIRRYRPTPALLVAMAALIAALTGTAVAAAGHTAHAAKAKPLRAVIRRANTPSPVLNPGDGAGSTVYCKPGERAVGGGGESHNGWLAVSGSEPQNASGTFAPGTTATGWHISFGNYSSTTQTATITAYAVCAKP